MVTTTEMKPLQSFSVVFSGFQWFSSINSCSLVVFSFSILFQMRRFLMVTIASFPRGIIKLDEMNSYIILIAVVTKRVPFKLIKKYIDISGQVEITNVRYNNQKPNFDQTITALRGQHTRHKLFSSLAVPVKSLFEVLVAVTPAPLKQTPPCSATWMSAYDCTPLWACKAHIALSIDDKRSIICEGNMQTKDT